MTDDHGCELSGLSPKGRELNAAWRAEKSPIVPPRADRARRRLCRGPATCVGPLRPRPPSPPAEGTASVVVVGLRVTFSTLAEAEVHLDPRPRRAVNEVRL